MSDGPVVGVVGPDAESVADAVNEAGGAANAGGAAAVLDDCEYVVAVGEAALLSVARERPNVPVLPVDAGRGVRSLTPKDVPAAIEDLLSGEYTREAHPLLDVTVGDTTNTTAFADVMLVSAEAAEISEYAVAAGGEQVARVRADGVVVATPAGSAGYGDAAGGPVVAPETDVAAVVPVAPFATDADHWVVGLESLSLTVERDETDVHLVVDDRAVGPVEPSDTVTLERDGTVEVAVVDASPSPFPD